MGGGDQGLGAEGKFKVSLNCHTQIFCKPLKVSPDVVSLFRIFVLA